MKEKEQKIISIIQKQFCEKANSLDVENETDNYCEKNRRGVEDVLFFQS